MPTKNAFGNFKYNHKYRRLYDKESECIKKIMEFSSMPDTSRHHWGTDVDIISFENHFFEKGHGEKAFLWLKKENSLWFYSGLYFGKSLRLQMKNAGIIPAFPLSTIYLKAYKKQVSPKHIHGFDGDRLVEELDIIQ